MKKNCSILVTILLSMISSVSLAATQSFWAYGSDDSHNQAKYLSNTGPGTGIKNISIDYALGNNWKNISAKLWLKAVDDSFDKGHCTSHSCADGSGVGEDASEQAEITKIEGKSGLFASTEINSFGWYNLGLNVTSYLLADKNNRFTAQVAAALGKDFYFKNAKLVVDYAVPVPAAIWLFAPALLGLIGFKRKA